MREFTEKQKDKLWKKEHGKSSVGKDPFGRKVSKYDFEADHIWPYEKNGKTTLKNGQVLSKKSNEEKSDKLNGYINRIPFKVEEISPGTGIGKMEKVNKKKVNKNHK